MSKIVSTDCENQNALPPSRPSCAAQASGSGHNHSPTAIASAADLPRRRPHRRGRSRHDAAWRPIGPAGAKGRTGGVLQVNGIEYSSLLAQEPRKGRTRLCSRIAHVPKISVDLAVSLLRFQADTAFCRFCYDPDDCLLILEASTCCVPGRRVVEVVNRLLVRDCLGLLGDGRVAAALQRANARSLGRACLAQHNAE